MPRFRYSAYTANGKLQKGELQADSELIALNRLSTRGLTPVALEEGGISLPWWQREINLTGQTQASENALELLFKTLSRLLSVELGLLKALRFCIFNCRDRAMMVQLERVLEEISEGSTLATSMRGGNGYFPERLITMIEIGEAADRLATVTQRIAEVLDQEAKQRREIRSAIIYPLILVVMSFFVMVILIFFLAPTLIPVFESTGTEVPSIMKAMNGLRVFIITKWYWPLAAGSSIIAAAIFYRRSPSRLFSEIFLRLPVIGHHIRRSETLKAMQNLSLMLASGTTLNHAMKIVSTTTQQPRYRRMFEGAYEHIVSGGKLSESLKKSKIIDPMTLAMIEAGEEANQLVPILDKTVSDLSARRNLALTQTIKMITPILTGLIGIIVGGIILSTVSAIMSLNDVTF